MISRPVAVYTDGTLPLVAILAIPLVAVLTTSLVTAVAISLLAVLSLSRFDVPLTHAPPPSLHHGRTPQDWRDASGRLCPSGGPNPREPAEKYQRGVQ